MSWPDWPQIAVARRRAAAGQRQAGGAPGRRPRPPQLRARGERDPAAGRRRGRLVRAVNDLPNCWTRPARSPRRPANGSPARPPRAPPGGSACTTAMPARSPRAASGDRSSSDTRPRSPTTTTASCSTTPSSMGNPPDAPQLAPAVARVTKRTGRTPGTVTADRGYGEKRVEDALHDLGVRTVVIPRKGKPVPGATSRRTPTSLPANHQMAHRLRRPDQHPQTRLRLGSNPHRRHRRRPDLGRARHL